MKDKKDKIVIIGASYLQAPLILKAKDISLETHTFAWKKGSVGRLISDFFYPISVVEKEKILKITKAIRPIGIISISSDLAYSTVNFIAKRLNLIHNPESSLRNCTNKFLMRQILSENEIPCPKFMVFRDGYQNMIGELKFPLIVKPTDRSGSRGVFSVKNEQQLNHAIKRALKESFLKEVLIEEFIPGREVSVEMITWKGNHYLLNITDKVTSGPPHFVELEHHQPSNISRELWNKIVNLTEKSLNILNIKYGASHSEFLITENNEVYVVEIGSRMGGDMIGSDLVYLSTGYDFLKGVIQVACGNFEEPRIRRNDFSGIIYLNPKPGKILDIIDNSSRFKSIIKKELFKSKGEYVPAISDSSQRIGYFIYHSTKEKLLTCVNDVIKIVTVDEQ